MPNWVDILTEIREENKTSPHDRVRRKYLLEASKITQRNVIAYYSGWLQKPGAFSGLEVNDKDIGAFMLSIHQLDKSKGLDLILHTPGGNLAATEALVNYLRSIFGNDIRAIIPQISMSAGTLIALSCSEIIMGKHSNLGPIDPQFKGIAAQEVVKEWNKAKEEIRQDPRVAPAWQVILSKYHPTFVAQCEHAISWSNQLATTWLGSNMCLNDASKVLPIVQLFSDNEENKSHSRHIPADRCKGAGLKITALEENQDLQDCILSLHHTYMHTFVHTNSLKIVENHKGIAYIETLSIKEE